MRHVGHLPRIVLISMFVFDILQIPGGCRQIFSGCSVPTCTPLTMGLLLPW